MKQIFLILSVALSASCNQNSKQVNLVNNKKDNREIIGSWRMCATSDDKFMTQMNSCPTINFIADGRGNVISNAITTQSFSWTLNKESMKILPASSFGNTTFSDTFYYAGFYKEKDLISLTLTHNHISFYLSK